MRTIIVTGSSGYIGSHVCTSLQKRGIPFIGIDRANGEYTRYQINLASFGHVEQVMQSITKNTVQSDLSFLHLAAMSSVTQCEEFQTSAFVDNCIVTEKLAHISLSYGIPFIFVSTIAAEDPQSVYGRSKLAAEKIITDYYLNPKFVNIVRLPNVIGGKHNSVTHLVPNFLKFLKNRIKENQGQFPVSAGHTRCYAPIHKVVDYLILQAGYPFQSLCDYHEIIGYQCETMDMVQLILDTLSKYHKVNTSRFLEHIHSSPGREGDAKTIINTYQTTLKNITYYFANNEEDIRQAILSAWEAL